MVLSTVAGTPQAEEAVIAAGIPQTAKVPLTNGPTFVSAIDGTPVMKPIAGTTLSYVANSDLPIIQVAPDSWYAVQTGVWFTAPQLTGPWRIATSVPPAIYSIPPSSPLYYVTYVQIYQSTPQYVYTGYTPGYTGSVVTNEGTVVYGTGYWYDPWVGTEYYPVPLTWGIDAVPIYNPYVGFAYGFGYPAALDPYWYWGTPWYAPAYWGTTCCGTVSEATNVYRAYGDTVASGTRTWYQDSNGKVGTTAQGNYYNNRTAFWASGENGSASSGGVHYIAFGQTGGTSVFSTVQNMRQVGVFDGQLYADTQSTAGNNTLRVFSIGSGLPTTANQTGANLPGVTTMNTTPNGFVLLDLNNMVAGVDTGYFADTRAINSGGGVQKWTFDGQNWTLKATFAQGITSPPYFVTAAKVGNDVVVIASVQESPNRLVRYIDDGQNMNPNGFALTTAQPSTNFRGVAVSPQ